MEAEVPLPSLRVLERIMRETTEQLALECACPSGQAPAWSELHWCIAQAVAAIQGVSPLLSRRLRWQGPRAWREFLDEQWRHTFDRHQGIGALMARIDAAARNAGLCLLALKGAALHDLAIYAPGERPMADLDLLVTEADLAASVALLETLGYRQSYRTRRERTFEPQGRSDTAHFGEHAGNALKIELHTQIAERLPVREASITERLLPESSTPGLHSYRSNAALMTHLLLHAAGNIRTRALRLIQLNDIAALSARLSLEEWGRILDGGGADQAWWAYPPLALSAHYFPGAISEQVLRRARAACPRLLRVLCERQRLSDVSLSYLWIQFCPGIEWCQSLSEALEFVHHRVFPSRETRAEIRRCEATQLWALNTAWSRSSRPRRVAQWLISRCPRDVTLTPIRAAWARSGMASDRLVDSGR
jgi:hypothetical protein